MRHFPRGQNRSHWVQLRHKLCTEIWRKEENSVSCANTILTSGVSIHGFPTEKSLNRQWTRVVQRYRPSKTSALVPLISHRNVFLRLDLVCHDSKSCKIIKFKKYLRKRGRLFRFMCTVIE